MNVARGCGYVQHYRERGNMVCLCSCHSIGMEPDRERGTVLGGMAMQLSWEWNLQGEGDCC